MFTTEQKDEEIKSNYKAVTNHLPNFKIESVETAPEEILTKVKMEMETADNKGLIVAIDNYTWLKDKYEIKSLKWLDRELSKLQRANQNDKPITLIKVFHTNDKYREYKPVENHHVQGGQNITNLTKNFIFLTPCGKGSDTRILKIGKDKIGGTKDTVLILRYAGTDPRQFVFEEEMKESEALPQRQSNQKRGSAQQNINSIEASKTSNVPSKRGPKEKFSIQQLQEMHQELENGSTWRQILENRGIEFSKNKTKGIKTAFKRHGLRG